MNKFLIFSFVCVLLSFSSQLYAADPCGGKKGGVNYCNMEGYFVCNDGTVSQSKRVCVTDENLDSDIMNNRLRNSDLPPVDFRSQPAHSITLSY